FEVVVAGNAEQVPNAGLLKTAKQEVADPHSLAGAAGHRFRLLRLVAVLAGQWSDRKSARSYCAPSLPRPLHCRPIRPSSTLICRFAAGEIENVSHAFHPSGRFFASNSRYPLRFK